MERVILHSDCNNFYASVECLYNPDLRDKPVAVGGDPEQRHGIILAKNYIAKKYGIQTGEALWQARQKCPNVVFVQPHFDRYMRFSQMAKEIYHEYTDQVESFGLSDLSHNPNYMLKAISAAITLIIRCRTWIYQKSYSYNF